MVKRFKFGSLKLIKNSDPDKYKYNDLGFGSCSKFSFKDKSIGK